MVAGDCKCGGYFPQSIQPPWTRDFEQVDRINTYGAFCLHSDIHDSIKVCGIKEPHIKNRRYDRQERYYNNLSDYKFKDDLMVEYATYGMDTNLFVSKYQLYLPNIEELKAIVNRNLDK